MTSRLAVPLFEADFPRVDGVTAEVYDIDPEISTVTMLANAGVDTWMVDYGAPENADDVAVVKP